MDLFDAMDRDDTKNVGGPTMSVDDSLQTNEPIINRDSDSSSSTKSSSSSIDSQYSDLPKQVRDSEQGKFDSDNSSSQQRGDGSSTLSKIEDKLGLGGKGSSSKEWSDLPKELRSPAAGSGVTPSGDNDSGAVTQDLSSTTVSDDMPAASVDRTSVKVGDAPAPTTASIMPMHGVNDEEGTTTVAGTTMWPFSHTIKKASVSMEPKDPSASEPSALMSAFTAAHSKLDDAVNVVRTAVDDLAEKHLRYDAEVADHQKSDMGAADIPTLMNSKDEANAEIVKQRMHPSHERNSDHHPEGEKRNMYS